MAPARLTKTLWSKSFPKEVSSQLFSYKCTHERGQKVCNKTFSRQCDLRHHQLNHTRPVRCKQCSRGFPSPKDLERHDNSVHNNRIRYCCPYDGCKDSINTILDIGILWAFRRKDHWQKHMKDVHKTVQKAVKEFQKNGIPMMVLRDEKWVALLPGSQVL